MKNITKENLLAFAADNTMIDDNLMKINQDGIIYIFETKYSGKIDITSDYDTQARTVGFVVDGTFYGTYYKYRELDKDFDVEITAFEDKFNAMYKEYISRYNAENLAPITENTEHKEWYTIEQRINDYKTNYLQRDAVAKVFDIYTGKENSNDTNYHKREFTPIFFDYLTNGEKVLEKYFADKAEKEAEDINYRILVNIECDKETEKLMQDKAFMQSVDIYGKLKKLNAKTVKITFDIGGKIFEGLKIDLLYLMRDIKYDGEIGTYRFTNNESWEIKNALKTIGIDRSDIPIDNIVKITYGKTTVYEK